MTSKKLDWREVLRRWLEQAKAESYSWPPKEIVLVNDDINTVELEAFLREIRDIDEVEFRIINSVQAMFELELDIPPGATIH